MLESESIPANIGLCFEKEVAGHAVEVDDVRDGRLGELHEDERARHARVCADAERDDLKGDVWKFRNLQQVMQLRLHDGVAANLPSERSFVDDAPQFERIVIAQDILALHPHLDAWLDV